MKKMNKFLIIALVVQVAILVCVFISTRPAKVVNKEDLLSFNQSEINEIHINGEDGEVILTQKDEDWFLPNYNSFSVPETKVSALLDALEKMSVDYPLATSKEALERFGVANNNAKTRITLKSQGKDIEELYLGSNSGLRKVHARTNEDNAVYAVEFSMHLAPSIPSEWMDKTILAVTEPIQAIETPEFSIQLNNDRWTSSKTLPEDKELNAEAIESWLEKFSNMEIASWADSGETEKAVIQEPLATFKITSSPKNAGTKVIEYVFYKANEKHYVKRFGENNVFSIYSYKAEEILDLKFDALLKSKDIQEHIDQPLQTIDDTDVKGA